MPSTRASGAQRAQEKAEREAALEAVRRQQEERNRRVEMLESVTDELLDNIRATGLVQL